MKFGNVSNYISKNSRHIRINFFPDSQMDNIEKRVYWDIWLGVRESIIDKIWDEIQFKIIRDLKNIQ